MNNEVQSESAVACENLGKIYHDGVAQIEVLRDVNLTVPRGELVAIVGNSGSGKSTLLHLLGGLDQPSSGAVKVAGKNLATLSENANLNMNDFLPVTAN